MFINFSRAPHGHWRSNEKDCSVHVVVVVLCCSCSSCFVDTLVRKYVSMISVFLLVCSALGSHCHVLWEHGVPNALPCRHHG